MLRWKMLASRWTFLCIAIFCGVIAVFLVRFALKGPTAFTNDSIYYSAGAKYIGREFFYSIDGVAPATEREPGYSFFLAPIFRIFGDENMVGVGLVQAVVYLFVVFLFVREMKKHFDSPVPSIALGFLLLSPSAFNIVLTPMRECLALSLFLIIATLFLSFSRLPSWSKAVGLGVFLGLWALTYASYLLFPFCFILLFLLLRLPLRFLAAVLLVPFIMVVTWMGRNAMEAGAFEFTGAFHTASLLHTRALQVQTFSFTDPFRCLWTEYVTRDMVHRSPYCATQYVTGDEAALLTIQHQSESVLLHALPMYLWVALFGAIEFHLPFVGGYGHVFNIIETMAVFFLYLGVILGLRHFRRPALLFFIIAFLYSMAVFPLLVAMPRHRMVTYAVYVMFASVGYAEYFRRRGSQRQELPGSK